MMFDSKFFQNNRVRLQRMLDGDGLVIMTANGLMQRSGDTTYPFRQDSNFFYLTGVEEPNVVLVIDAKSGEEFLILPKQTEVERFFGGAINRDKIAKISGITTIYSHNEGWNQYKELQQSRSKIYTLLAPPVQFTRQERLFTSPARRLLLQKIKRISKAPILPLHEEMIKLRSIKQLPEIEAIKAAIKITGEGIAAVRSKVKQGVYEYELEAELDYVFKKRNSRHGFMPPIIAAGKNTTVLHYQEGQAKVQPNDLVLLDVGAEVQNYSADISRTYKVGGKMTAREKAVYSAAEAVYHLAIGLLKDGVSWRDFIIKVDSIMGEELIKLGLITVNSRENVRQFFPHSIGHSLGLDTHDSNDYTQPLQANMVVAIEPGIYIPEEGIGVRIEDDVLITKTGAENLSAHIPYQ